MHPFQEIALTIPTETLQIHQASLRQNATAWCRATIVDHKGVPWIQPHTSRKHHQRGLFFLPSNEVSHDLRLRIAPSRDQIVITTLPFPVRTPEATLNQFIGRCIKKWTDAFAPHAAERMRLIIDDITRDKAAVRTQRWRLICHVPSHHVSIRFDEYTPRCKRHSEPVIQSYLTLMAEHHVAQNLPCAKVTCNFTPNLLRSR